MQKWGEREMHGILAFFFHSPNFGPLVTNLDKNKFKKQAKTNRHHKQDDQSNPWPCLLHMLFSTFQANNPAVS